jgi:uncharacterized protein (TIGR02246 family)
MKRLIGVLILSTITLFDSGTVFGAARSQDEAAIRQLQVEQEAAWNRHDAAAYANLFTEDGDCVNVLGWWWKGRAQIESRLTAAFAFVFRESALTVTDVQIKFLSPAIAIAHVRWTMKGYKFPPGMLEPKEGIEVQTLSKRGKRWLIESFQNTNSVPERPFPTGAGPAVPTAAAPPSGPLPVASPR